MSNTDINVIAAERRTERYIEALCNRLINDLIIIRDTSDVTWSNLVRMNRLITLVESAELPIIQSRLILRGLDTEIVDPSAVK